MSGGTSDAGTDFDVDFGGEGDLGSDHATVSYTHLDVYKRQLQNNWDKTIGN